nr:reversion-inducing cysteine-rich protein with Kazal motifs [Ciona intestinalis]|eukprot:XP_026694412.1 reversion-inducing cysteine-rich protein with Kazal motifs [Ciona intestinalis]
MKLILISIFLLSTIARYSVALDKDGAHCCNYATSDEKCHDTCMQIYHSTDKHFVKQLHMYLPMHCPKSDRMLRHFWSCINQQNETEGVWVGRKCCEYSTTDECRSACLQARSKADITSHCRSNEKGLDACIFKQLSRQQCCGRRSNASSLCRHQCDDAFRAESGPTTDDVAQLASRCGVTMGSCLRNFTIELRKNSNESMHCCDRATKPGCKASCRHILRTETSDQVMADKLDVACGPVMPHEPMWKCFMHDSKPLDGGTGGVFLREVQCCSRAVSKTCDQLCQKSGIEAHPMSGLSNAYVIMTLPSINQPPSGCRMGHGSEFIVPVGSVVRVEDRSRGEGCFRSCTCVTSGDLVYCEPLPCTDKRQSCKLAGQVKSHGTSFYVDCNFCSCFSGNVTCTKRQCMTSHSTLEDKRRFTGVPCNCKPYYTPVCGSNGVTYRSLCVARCLGLAHHHIQPGACSQLDPCISNPCPSRERCIATPRVCLTRTNRCQQYECLPRNKQCPRLLSSAILPQSRKAFKHRRRQLDYQDILSSSHFFSNSDYLSKNNAVCDVNNKQYDNICKLVRSRRFKKISHKGNCDAACPSDGSRRVCGHDHVTYNSSCVAMATGIFPDYVGPCRPISYGTDGELSTCAGVKCAALSNPGCKPVTPPGSCCPICAGLLRVLVSTPHLMAIPQRSWKGPVTVRDIVWILRRHLNVLECATYGQLTTEGDLVIMTLSTIDKPSLLQTKACSSEAERLSRLINSRSPTLTSDLILSTLTAATWTSTDKDSSSSYMTSSLMTWVLALIAHYLCWYVT